MLSKSGADLRADRYACWNWFDGESHIDIFGVLRCSSISKLTRFSVIRVAYIAYHIWLARNSLIFEFKQQSAWFIMEKALTQVAEMFYSSLSNLILRFLDP